MNPSGSAGGSSGAGGGRVLCVDDEESIRDILRDVLTDEGFDVRTAPHGAAALALLADAARDGWRPDVILLDINMPVMDGYAFARAYRERGDSGGGGAPIVVITAGGRLPSAAEHAGAVAYVPKPFDLDVLVETVRTHQRAA